MKILLSTTPFTRDQFLYIRWPEFPVYNLPLLASGLMADGHDVRIVSNLSCRRSPHKIEAAIAEFNPDLIGLSIPSAIGNIAVQKHLPPLINKHPDIHFIAGGQYATIDFSSLLEIGFDAVVLGPGEETIKAMAGALEQGAGLEHIPGIAIKDSRGKVVKTSVRPYRPGLDGLPVPAWNLMPDNRKAFGWGPAVSMETSRGCPFQCRFCSVHEFWGKYHEKSNDRIIQEMRELYALGVRELFLVDIAFGNNTKKMMELAGRMIDEDHQFKFGCFIRADTVVASPEAISLLARAGLRYAYVGFESYNSDELKWMKKKTTPFINKQASRILRDNQVAIIGLHMFFLPGSKIRHAVKTYIHGMHRSDLFKCGSFVLYPDAPAACRVGQQKKHFQTSDYDCHHVLAGQRWQKNLNQIALYMLMLWSVASPRQWLRVFSTDRHIADIVRLEYKTYFYRLFWWLREKI